MDNFIVSARKYRPATFRSVVGQSHITSTLKNAIGRSQLAHAYLFCGPRGVGKTTCARIFAKAINCLNPADGEACNDCESCKAFNEGRSFSIHELDAASNNSVDDIRNLTEQVRIPPQVGQYSVYIIDEVHMLSLSAFNAFLKTLEEPPAHAVFILATTEKHKIIPTILSRCQIYDFNRIRVEDAVEYLRYIALQEAIESDEESFHIIARKADGGMRDALSMFDKVVSFCGPSLSAVQVAETLNVLDYDTYFTATDHILAGNYSDVLVLFDGVLRKGFGGQTFVAGLNEHMRNLLMSLNPQTLPLIEVTGTISGRYQEQGRRSTLPFLFESVNLLTELDSGFRTATNQRLHVELGLMKLCGMGQKKNIADGDASAGTPLSPCLPDPVSSIISATKPTEKTQSNPSGFSETRTLSEENAIVPAIEISDAANGNDLRHVHPSISPSEPEVAGDAGLTESNSTSETVSFRKESPGITGPLSGFSLKNILTQNPSSYSKIEEEAIENPGGTEEKTFVTDQNAPARLIEACMKLAGELQSERPRLATAFNSVKVEEDRIILVAPNESLKDEIERNMLDLKKRLSEIGQIHYPVHFVIQMKKDTVQRPVSPEDKFRFLMSKNANLDSFKKSLQLDME